MAALINTNILAFGGHSGICINCVSGKGAPKGQSVDLESQSSVCKDDVACSRTPNGFDFSDISNFNRNWYTPTQRNQLNNTLLTICVPL